VRPAVQSVDIIEEDGVVRHKKVRMHSKTEPPRVLAEATGVTRRHNEPIRVGLGQGFSITIHTEPPPDWDKPNPRTRPAARVRQALSAS